MTKPELFTHLESLVDQHSFSTVLCLLTDIAHGKAEHLASAWQDRLAARKFTALAKKLSSAEAHAERNHL